MSRPVTVPFLILKRFEDCCGDAKNILRSQRSKVLNYSQRYREENTKRGEKWRNRRWADWFHTWKANTEPLVSPTKRLDSARRPGPEPERELVVQPYLPCAATEPSPPACPSCLKTYQRPFPTLQIPKCLLLRSEWSKIFMATFFPESGHGENRAGGRYSVQPWGTSWLDMKKKKRWCLGCKLPNSRLNITHLWAHTPS